LAWHTLRHARHPGNRSFGILVGDICLLGLAEVLSLLGGSPDAALFWYKIRFLFIAALPVLGVWFALEYTGRSTWLSKRLLAGMLLMLLLTQIVLWTNSWHGWWVEREVGFHQAGPFWLADVHTRIPGLWFLFHTFYSMALGATGMAIIAYTVWRLWQTYRRQAFLLVAGGLVITTASMLSSFGLLPPGALNPFVPSFGGAALLWALSISRYHLLHRSPAQEKNPTLTRFTPQEKRSLSLVVLIFIVMSVGILATGLASYQHYERYFRAQVNGQLAAVAALQVDELRIWRMERLADAGLFYRNENFVLRLQDYLEDPADQLARTRLMQWLVKLGVNPEYARIFFLDPQGVEQFSLPAVPEPPSIQFAGQVVECLEADRVTFVDFQRSGAHEPVFLYVLVPIYELPEGGLPLGVLVFQIDPVIYLYPMIDRWPAPSVSGEGLLVRRDGSSALVLNNLKFHAGAALNLRLSLEDQGSPVARAITGVEGALEGVDYRAVPVVAYGRAVPGSPWFLLAKLDTAEVYTPLRDRLWMTVFLVGVLLFVPGIVLGWLWRQQRVRYFQEQVRVLETLHLSEEKFKSAFLIFPDALAITRLSDGRFLSANQGFTDIFGYTEQEVIGRTSFELNIWVDALERQKAIDVVQSRGILRNFETQFRARDGRRFYGLLSAVPFEISGETHILNATRDITERKRTERTLYLMLQTQHQLANLERPEDIYRLVGQKIQEIIGDGFTVISMLDENLQAMKISGLYGFGNLYEALVNRFKIDVTKMSYPLADMTDEELRIFRSGRLEKFNGGLYALLTRKVPQAICEAIEKQLKVSGIYTMGFVWPDSHLGGVSIIARGDITPYRETIETVMNQASVAIKRGRAEDALRVSEEKYRLLAENISDVIWILDVETSRIRYISPSVQSLTGFGVEEVVDQHFAAIVTPETADEFNRVLPARLERMKQGVETEYVDELEHPCKNGGTVWTETTTHFVTNSETGHREIYGVSRNITERRQAEKELRFKNDLLRMTSEMAQIGGWEFDAQTLEGTWTDEAARIHDLDPSVPTNVQIGVSFYVDDSRSKIDQAIREAIEAGQPYDLELEMVSAKGVRKWVRTIALPIMEGGKVIRVRGIFQDITERRQNEQKLQAYSEHLEELVEERTHDLRAAQEKLVRQEKLAVLGQLAGSIGHELRNPLGVISNAVYFLKIAQPEADPRVKEYLTIVETEVRRSDKIISDLLNFTRLRAAERDRVSVPDLVHQTLLRFPPPPAVSLQLDLPADLPPAYVDFQQMVQVLGNLVENACQAMPDGGVLGIAAEAQRDMISISVQDTGIGISSENMEKVFEPLFTTKSRGIGLGLAVSKKLVEINRGQIEVKSITGQGSTFRFSVPVHHAE